MPQLTARQSVAVPLKQGQSLQVINTHGKQVVDFWAFNPKDSHDYLSMSHTRAMLSSISLHKGNNLYNCRRKPILTLIEDTTPGIHDMLFPACDAERYRQLGAVGYHDNCHDNMHKALKDFPHINVADNWVPDPLNLFMNVAVDHRGGIDIRAPTSEKGQYVILRAEVDVVIAMSACPQDMVNVNADGPADCEYRVIEDSDKA
ncbi:polysaccharide deacetylase family protein [Fusarium austroafricanum]|uniref:Polysaccharide deacetylase family protein n=1 Tax=Fusarium austroafricanum TaxID=2364996 RepID=A0A8H4JPI2_9HYPO|nr:polysaccharide deacetylase family protein [Fusarium austroafricanum]